MTQKEVLINVQDADGKWVRGGVARVSNAQYAHIQRMLNGRRGMLAYVVDDRPMPALSTGEEDVA